MLPFPLFLVKEDQCICLAYWTLLLGDLHLSNVSQILPFIPTRAQEIWQDSDTGGFKALLVHIFPVCFR